MLKEELLTATNNGDLKEVINLVNQGANVNTPNNKGSTVLHLAARNGNYDVAKVLLDHGANINTKDNFGLTVCHYVAIAGNLEFLSYLIERGADMNILGGDYNRSALHLAANNARLDCVALLIEQGADLDIKDSKGQTALDIAKHNATSSTNPKKSFSEIALLIESTIENRTLDEQIKTSSPQNQAFRF